MSGLSRLQAALAVTQSNAAALDASTASAIKLIQNPPNAGDSDALVDQAAAALEAANATGTAAIGALDAAVAAATPPATPPGSPGSSS